MLGQALTPSVVLGFIVSIIGFYLSNVTEEVRAGRAMTYSIGYESTDATLTLRNVSRAVSIEDTNIFLVCEDLRNDCFTPIKPNQFFSPIFFAPAKPELLEIENSAQLVQVKLSLVSGAAVSIRVIPSDISKKDLLFYYASEKAPAESLVALAGGSFEGLLVTYYFDIMAAAFVGAIAVIGVTVLGFLIRVLIFPTLRKSKVLKKLVPQPGKEETKVERIELRILDDRS